MLPGGTSYSDDENNGIKEEQAFRITNHESEQLTLLTGRGGGRRDDDSGQPAGLKFSLNQNIPWELRYDVGYSKIYVKYIKESSGKEEISYIFSGLWKQD